MACYHFLSAISSLLRNAIATECSRYRLPSPDIPYRANRTAIMINASKTIIIALLATLSAAQTLRKYNNRGCRGALAICSVRSDVGADQDWQQASCCQRGVKKSGSLRITGVEAGVGEISIIYRGNFNTQCSVQDSVFLGAPVSCFTTRSLGTGAWLSCARQYVNPSFNQNCSNYKKKRRTIGNATSPNDDGEKVPDDEVDTSSTELVRPDDPEYLAPGFYDAFERPISEDEYWRQVAWEDEHDAPFIPGDAPALVDARQDDGLLEVTTYTGAQCRSARLAKITESDKCYQSGNGSSFFVTGLPSNCKVITYTNTGCTEGAFTVIQGIRGVGAAGCYDTDSFEGIAVVCG